LELEIKMKNEDVPQDDDIHRGIKEITYAVDHDGRYLKVPSLGWEPKNVANEQAWEVIRKEIESEIKLVKAGKRSPLAYHMVKNLMSPRLLADYADLSLWRVKRHLKAKVFKKLEPEMLKRYADVFDITVEQLHEIPEVNSSFYEDEY
jgi:hypothetical protein